MSASVFKPIRPLSLELPRLRASMVNRSLRGMEKVRRVLFEPVDHVETEKFLERELAQHNLNGCNKWEFDFNAEKPYNLNNNNGRYLWKPITTTANGFAPRKRQFQEEYDNSELYPTLPEKPEAMLIDTTTNDDKSVPSSIDLPKRQSKITDFMQSRKRPADLAFAKKTSSSPVPTKRASQSS